MTFFNKLLHTEQTHIIINTRWLWLENDALKIIWKRMFPLFIEINGTSLSCYWYFNNNIIYNNCFMEYLGYFWIKIIKIQPQLVISLWTFIYKIINFIQLQYTSVNANLKIVLRRISKHNLLEVFDTGLWKYNIH